MCTVGSQCTNTGVHSVLTLIVHVSLGLQPYIAYRLWMGSRTLCTHHCMKNCVLYRTVHVTVYDPDCVRNLPLLPPWHLTSAATSLHCLRLRTAHCCQVSPRFPGQFKKKNLQNKEKNLHSHSSIFCDFGKEIFSVQTAPEKVIIVGKCFLAPFLPLLTKIGGLTAKIFPQPKDFIWGSVVNCRILGNLATVPESNQLFFKPGRANRLTALGHSQWFYGGEGLFGC